jgi:hypothetical protein
MENTSLIWLIWVSLIMVAGPSVVACFVVLFKNNQPSNQTATVFDIDHGKPDHTSQAA